MDDGDNMFLRNLENGSDIEPSDNYYQEDEGEFGEEEEDDDPELLGEMERRKEEILEEFLEQAYERKHAAVEEVKAEAKRAKMAKEVEKKKVGEVQTMWDVRRKEGMKMVKERI